MSTLIDTMKMAVHGQLEAGNREQQMVQLYISELKDFCATQSDHIQYLQQQNAFMEIKIIRLEADKNQLQEDLQRRTLFTPIRHRFDSSTETELAEILRGAASPTANLQRDGSPLSMVSQRATGSPSGNQGRAPALQTEDRRQTHSPIDERRVIELIESDVN